MRLVRHRGKWAVRIDGRRFSTGIDASEENRNAAERKARAISAALAAAETKTAGEILGAYKLDMAERLRGVAAPERIAYAERALLPFWGSHRPEDVTPGECRAYAAKRRSAGKSDGTVRRELGVLRAALRWKDPATPARFDFPATPPARDRWLTREEFARLLDAAQGQPHVVTFLHVAIATGARKEAILGLRWDQHIDFDRRTIWLGFKQSGKGRATVPMTRAVQIALRDARENALTEWVVEWAGGPVKDIRKALTNAYARAGLADVKAPAHTLRHTAGAWMAQAGVPMHEISVRLGHSSIAVTERHYAHLHPEGMAKSTDALEV